MAAKLNDIRAFVDNTGRAVYGRVLVTQDLAAGEVLVMIDTDGCLYRVFAMDTYGLGQKLGDGTVLIASSRTEYEVAQSTEPYINDPMVSVVLKRLQRLPFGRFGMLGALGTVATARREWLNTRYQAFDAVPLRMFTGRQLDDAGKPKMTVAMERYLNDSDERRLRFEGLLRRLKQRAPAQHLVYVAVELRGMSQADVCRAFKLRSGNVSTQYRNASDWIDARMGTNVAGV